MRHCGPGSRPPDAGPPLRAEVRAIIAHDRGQTALGYLELIDFEAVRADPKPILGYSDISLLHLVLFARTGLVGFHADQGHPWPGSSLAGRARGTQGSARGPALAG